MLLLVLGSPVLLPAAPRREDAARRARRPVRIYARHYLPPISIYNNKKKGFSAR